jgi:RNA polymerase sigma factor (TIGR02999 family)
VAPSALGHRRSPRSGAVKHRSTPLRTPAIDAPLTDELGTLVSRADGGDHRASDQLFAALYAELHRIAERQLDRRGSDLSLGATTLLHEAYLDLSARGTQFAGKSHFMAYASRAMRALVVDSVRRHRAVKRGGEFHITAIDAHEAAGATPAAPSFDVDALAEALEQLTAVDARLTELVDLHFFCGFTFAEIATMRDVSERTVQRDWRKARVMLQHALLDDDDPQSPAPSA